MIGMHETLERVMACPSGVYDVKRRSPDGRIQSVETTFDHALTSLKAFEISGDRRYLRVSLRVCDENRAAGPIPRWNFSRSVPDIPPDADSTAMTLLLFQMMDVAGISCPSEGLKDLAMAQFDRCIDEEGAVRTFLGARHVHDDPPDPVVNSAVAFLYVVSGGGFKDGDGCDRLNDFLNRQVMSLKEDRRISRYYPKGLYFAVRMAKLESYVPGYVDEPGILEKFLCSFTPRNSLETALISTGLSYRGLAGRARLLNKELEKKRGRDGLWSIGTLYTQRSPPFGYGHGRLTSLFALEALRLEETGPNKVCLSPQK